VSSQQLFSAARDCKVFTGGVEYDRHSWGYGLKARLDYAPEFLPVVILSEPAKADVWGNPQTKAKQLVPGIGLSPMGIRMLWRPEKNVKPFFSGKVGFLLFPQKVLSPDATYENLSVHATGGLQTVLTKKTDLRLGFSYFHFSDAYLVKSNPGLDVMAVDFGISYHLGKVK